MSPFCGQQLPASKKPDRARKLHGSRNNAYGRFGSERPAHSCFCLKRGYRIVDGSYDRAARWLAMALTLAPATWSRVMRDGWREPSREAGPSAIGRPGPSEGVSLCRVRDTATCERIFAIAQFTLNFMRSGTQWRCAMVPT